MIYSHIFLPSLIFHGISDYRLKLLRDSGRMVSEDQRFTQVRSLFSVLNGLQKPDLAVSEWLMRLDDAIAVLKCLERLEERPEEKEAYISKVSACESGMPLCDFAVADLAGCGANSNVITLTTLHSSKGLQFDVVIIPGMEQGRLPSFGATTEHAIREARRTFYVGVTRARQSVYLFSSGWYRNRWGRMFRNGPSSFVLELQQSLQCQIEQ